MNKKDRGGPAFPEVRIKTDPLSEDTTRVYYGGMSLRDYFAAKAMNGLLACGEAHDENTACCTAEDAYKIADAMIKARSE